MRKDIDLSKTKISFFSTQPYDNVFFEKYNADFGFELDFFETQLNTFTVNLIQNSSFVFLNDVVNVSLIEKLPKNRVKKI